MLIRGGEGGIDSRGVISAAFTPFGALRLSAASKLCPGQSLSNLRFSSHLDVQIKTPPQWRRFYLDGGEGGIRTLDTLLTYTPLAGERLQPLGHFSKFGLFRSFLMSLLRSPVARYSVLCTSPFGSPPYRRRSFAVLDCSVSHSATSPSSFSFPRTLPPPLPQSG